MARVNTQQLEVPNKIYCSWQDMLEILAQFSHVPVAMINRLNQHQLDVFCCNHNIDNPIRVGDTFALGEDHFCETTLKTDSILVVPDRNLDPKWQQLSKPLTAKTQSYLGIPLHWPNGTPFGTLSILDNKINHFKISIRELLSVFKDSVEAQLTVIYQNQKLQLVNKELHSRIQNRTVELANLSYQLDKESTKRKQLEREIHYQQHHDTGSGLLNAKAWELETNRIVNQADLHNQEVSVFYLGISNGQRIQIDMGAETLDQIIKQIKDKLGELGPKTQLSARPRSNDIAFTLLSNNDNKNYDAIIRHIMDVTSQDFDVPSGKVRLQVYVGASISHPQRNPQNMALTVQAYQAMQNARESGKRILFYDDNQIEGGTKLNRLESYFIESIRDNAIKLFYQPQIAIKNGQWHSASTSIRWDHPILGNVSELSISQLCDQPEIADALCHFMVRKSIYIAKQWRAIKPHFRVAIKLNACQLASKDLAMYLHLWLKEAQIPGEALEIEVSEKQLFANESTLQATLEQISSLGINLTLCDFGHGHASFSYLKHSPFKRIKIDKSFTDNLQHSSEDRSFLHSLMQITTRLGLDTVLTGVESKEQEQWLLQFDTPYAEGKKYHGPMTRKDFEQFLYKQSEMNQH
ncbi:EAL domain-containing protein [Vibrio sp. B1Z05]|uniref:sensor domain-containing phosphodiesterase n=1 Tax=Vibrio sp. B1Z05 TaxID=2654980 RepID=UPI00128B0C5D|nr:GGDEF and EAL domain-containing protein [Vibrio sp. B1Z05]MPW37904.1 EAL domain-containing protein [Vibrio sp. B1Z05]